MNAEIVARLQQSFQSEALHQDAAQSPDMDLIKGAIEDMQREVTSQSQLIKMLLSTGATITTNERGEITEIHKTYPADLFGPGAEVKIGVDPAKKTTKR